MVFRLDRTLAPSATLPRQTPKSSPAVSVYILRAPIQFHSRSKFSGGVRGWVDSNRFPRCYRRGSSMCEVLGPPHGGRGSTTSAPYRGTPSCRKCRRCPPPSAPESSRLRLVSMRDFGDESLKRFQQASERPLVRYGKVCFFRHSPDLQLRGFYSQRLVAFKVLDSTGVKPSGIKRVGLNRGPAQKPLVCGL